jgi:hypothetical protein
MVSYSQTDIVEGEAHAGKGSFVDVNISTRAVGYFVVTPVRRGCTSKRKRNSKKTQDDRGFHWREISGLVAAIEERRSFGQTSD